MRWPLERVDTWVTKRLADLTAACRLLMKLVDYNLLAFVSALAGPLLPDFWRAQAHTQAKKAQ